ncbi:MAG TPA: acetyl-CoA hydrolase/transferase C-terminal domain-containing protein [Polyangiaceae bacterium]|nr:acetyl-CoA hydrolase/transferase C-terminal domain-containing protein [Polyangiaceae bacterium]
MTSHRDGALPVEEVARKIQSHDRVFLHGAAATPTSFLAALAKRTDVEGVRLYHLHLAGELPHLAPELAHRFRSVAFFVGPKVRDAVAAGRADFMPVFLSDIPELFRNGTVPLDVAVVQLSPPDKHGIATLGASCDAARAAVDSARIVIAEINERMPRTHGATAVPMSRLAAYSWVDQPLATHPSAEIGEVEAKIGDIIADLIEDGATLQTGIGAIPDAVLARLGNKSDLGVHTEMFSDGLLPLLRSGVITNRRKSIHPGRTVASFVTGSRELFEHIDDNQLIELHPCDRTNDSGLIRQLDGVVAINSAIEVDLSGQVCADSMGHAIYSGIGGQMDFIRAAALSKGGKPIIALPSTARGGQLSRIVPSLKPGAGVVTTRGHVHWIVTEHGARNLHGLTLRERAAALIDLAHPDFRGELRRAINETRHFDLQAKA